MDKKRRTIILGIESSCDDTAAAVNINGETLSNVIANQTVHEEYGGVVPELASRAHQEHILPVVDQALKQAGCELSDIDGIAVTSSPGLLGSLIVGVSFAKALSLSLDVPVIDVNHMHAHLMSNLIEAPRPAYPFLCLTVSGGHTEISVVRSPLTYEVIGRTLDDAAGEAFDKTGKMLDLPYPSGPIIDRLSEQGAPVFTFPRAKVPGLDFSFSGLKTAIRYFLRDAVKENADFIAENLNDICASVQFNIVAYLLDRLTEAAAQTGIKRVAIAGGVSANAHLRERLSALANELQWDIYIPHIRYCTDNAAMIAMVGYYKLLEGQCSDLTLSPSARA